IYVPINPVMRQRERESNTVKARKSRKSFVERINTGRAKLSSFRASLYWQGDHVKMKLCSIHPSAKGELPCNWTKLKV
ncbi:hypothetical protein, partial [Amphritea sp.]|uniref:hypothetical protein n=1 Tax=Amphritea sp. TaxID=1872502 RepID=UPI003D129951